MAQPKRTKKDKTEEREQDSSPGKKTRQPLYDQVKAPDEGVIPAAELVFKPSMHSHAALLAGARSGEHRANIVAQLQQSYGNAYVQRLLRSKVVQAKLTVNPPDDAYEREADAVAEAVTQASSSDVQRQEEEELQAKTVSEVQRQEEEEPEEELRAKRLPEVQLQEEEELQAKAISEVQLQEEEELQAKTISELQLQEEEELQAKTISELQRQEEEEPEEELRAKTAGSEPSPVSEDLESRINAARGGGQSLSDSARASLEPKFGRDFGDVRVHTDTEADSLSRQLGAEAFTTGKDIFFREGAYQPDTSSGKGLIAHEMTHVVQQEASPALQRVVPVVPGPSPTAASTEVPDLTNRTYKKVNAEITWGSKQKAIDLILAEVQDTKMPRLSECEDPPVEYDSDLKDTGLTTLKYDADADTVSEVKVYIGTAAFDSVSWLYSTMMHEYQHVVQVLTDAKATTERVPIAEFAAWSWEIFHAHETGVVNNPAKMEELGQGLLREAWNKMTEREKNTNRDTFIRALEIVVTATGANQ